MSQLCSVICLSYNHAKFAEESLQSVFAQTYRELELVILDDGSSDGTVDRVRQALESSPFPSDFIAQSNEGNVARNVNRAIARASGDYLTFLSLDDRLMPDTVERKVKLLATDANIVFAADTGYQVIDETGAPLGIERRPDEVTASGSVDALIENERAMIGFFIQGQLFRRDAINTIGGFDEDLNGDDIILRVKLLRHIRQNPALRFHFSDGVSFAHRTHPSNLAGNTFRQVKTAIDLKERFFPDRPYPDVFYVWLETCFRKCLSDGAGADLQTVLDYHPVIADYYEVHRKSWKYRGRVAKSKLKRLLKSSGDPG
ncbi:MAG: glycosyltransferase [Pseudomonadota bacterium]